MSINTVCLCGSTRFLSDFDAANKELSSRGFSVITISMCLPKNAQDIEGDQGLKELLDLVHINKILRSDAIFVVGDGYIGRSTAREILWAYMQGKPIIRQSETHGNWNMAANFLRSASWGTDIIPKARKTLGLAP